MASVLILYSTTDGHTVTICERMRTVIEAGGHRVTLANIDGETPADLDGYDKVVIGASIRYGKHRPVVARFIREHLQFLESRPNALFSVNIVARKPNKNEPQTNPYMKKFLRRISWQPQHMAVFAGKLNYPIYGFLDRQMIRLIMVITRGPTDPTAVVEFTDWNKVEEFARLIRDM